MLSSSLGTDLGGWDENIHEPESVSDLICVIQVKHSKHHISQTQAQVLNLSVARVETETTSMAGSVAECFEGHQLERAVRQGVNQDNLWTAVFI